MRFEPGLRRLREATAPALFTLSGSSAGAAAALNQDGNLNTAPNPPRRGEIVTLFGTGEGETSPPGKTGSLVSDLLEVEAP